MVNDARLDISEDEEGFGTRDKPWSLKSFCEAEFY